MPSLPIHVADEEIVIMLEQYLAMDSKIYVKVKRMRDGMPFAHVQYHVSLYETRPYRSC